MHFSRIFMVAAPLMLVAGGLAIGLAGDANAQKADRPLYKDASQPVERRVADLLSRMTLEEKIGQMITVWEHKDRVQTPAGDFSPERASQAFPNGLGQVARPSDRRGVSAPAATSAAGANARQLGRDARETADYINAAQHWAMERTRLGIPILFHEEALHG